MQRKSAGRQSSAADDGLPPIHHEQIDYIPPSIPDLT